MFSAFGRRPLPSQISYNFCAQRSKMNHGLGNVGEEVVLYINRKAGDTTGLKSKLGLHANQVNVSTVSRQ